MFKIRFVFLVLVTVLTAGTAARADIVVLHSGERIEGKVVGETEQEFTIDVRVSASITDHRVVVKSDVAKMVKIGPDEEAYQALLGIQVGSNSLRLPEYEPRIAALKVFLTQYSTSPRSPDVQKVLDDLTAEKLRVTTGEVKIRGRWLGKDEALKEKIQIGGQQTFDLMKSLSAAGDFPGALDAFTILEKEFTGAKVTPDAIDLAKQLLANLNGATQRALSTQKAVQAEREKGFAAASPANRVELMAAYQRSQAQAEAAVAAAEKAGKWPPLITISEKSVTTLQARVMNELKRVSGLPVANLRTSIKLEERAGREVVALNVDAALATLKEALVLWPANELAKRRQADLEKVKLESPVATPPPAPTSTPPRHAGGTSWRLPFRPTIAKRANSVLAFRLS